MSFRRAVARSKQYEGVSPNKARPTVVSIISTAAVMVFPIQRAAPVRSESYRRWVAGHDCFACGISGYSQAAHPNQGRGLGQKASDLDVFPLCATRPGHMGCHVMHDTLIDMTLTQRREAEVRYVARMHAMALAAGRREAA